MTAVALRLLLLFSADAWSAQLSAAAPFKDPRNASNPLGVVFSAGNGSGYSDQPQVVIFNASYWLCVLTCSPGHEGQRSQIAATVA